jgi:hypothetical protein
MIFDEDTSPPETPVEKVKAAFWQIYDAKRLLFAHNDVLSQMHAGDVNVWSLERLDALDGLASVALAKVKTACSLLDAAEFHLDRQEGGAQ